MIELVCIETSKNLREYRKSSVKKGNIYFSNLKLNSKGEIYIWKKNINFSSYRTTNYVGIFKPESFIEKIYYERFRKINNILND